MLSLCSGILEFKEELEHTLFSVFPSFSHAHKKHSHKGQHTLTFSQHTHTQLQLDTLTSTHTHTPDWVTTIQA